MNKEQVVKFLKEISSDKFKQNVVKLGIPEDNSIGVSTGDIRKLARKLEKSQELAEQLWETKYHEAKILSVLLMDEKTIVKEDIERLMIDVKSWDLCDHICKNLIVKLADYKEFIYKWCDDNRVYYKRAAYSLIATVAIHSKDLSIEEVHQFLDMIKEYSNDNRTHVKKAMSWALREIGKRDFECQEKAILLAHELKESSDKDMIWIGKNALKELQTLVSVKERGRLLTSKSKMGSQQ